eukprot:1511456-Amphidinium_carterae.1
MIQDYSAVRGPSQPQGRERTTLLYACGGAAIPCNGRTAIADPMLSQIIQCRVNRTMTQCVMLYE